MSSSSAVENLVSDGSFAVNCYVVHQEHKLHHKQQVAGMRCQMYMEHVVCTVPAQEGPWILLTPENVVKPWSKSLTASLPCWWFNWLTAPALHVCSVHVAINNISTLPAPTSPGATTLLFKPVFHIWATLNKTANDAAWPEDLTQRSFEQWIVVDGTETSYTITPEATLVEGWYNTYVRALLSCACLASCASDRCHLVKWLVSCTVSARQQPLRWLLSAAEQGAVYQQCSALHSRT